MKKLLCMMLVAVCLLTGCKGKEKDNNGSNEGSYAQAYCQVLTYLLEKYGVVRHDLVGVEYAELVDFEQDGVPELICGISTDDGGQVAVFRYDGGVVREILNTLCGTFWVSETEEGKPLLALIDTVRTDDSYENSLERINIFTIDDETLLCRTALGLQNYRFGEYAEKYTYVYTACQIDGMPVSVEEYVRLRDLCMRQPRKDYLFDIEQAVKDLQEWMDELTQAAETKRIDITTYTQAGEPSQSMPYQSSPFTPSNMEMEIKKISAPTPADNVLTAYRVAQRKLFSDFATQQFNSDDGVVLEHCSYEKVDFENDGLPEIIVRYDKNEHTGIFYLFHYSNGSFQQMLRLEKTMSDGLGKAFLRLCDWNHLYYAILHRTEDELGVSHSLYYSIQDGKLVCDDYTCDVDWSGEKAVYSNCTINGEIVSPETYEARCPHPNTDRLDGIYELYGRKDMRSLAVEAGMPPEEIDALLTSVVAPSYSVDKMEYRVQSDTLDVSLDYPQIHGLEDRALEEKINQTLYQKGVSDYIDWDYEGLNCDGSYSVMLQGGSYLSILFEGLVSPKGAAHPHFRADGVTIDMKTGEILALSDLLDVNTLSAVFTLDHVKQPDIKNVLVEYPDAVPGMEAAIESQRDAYIGADHLHTDDYYITDQTIGLIIGVPHAAGDYWILEGPREDAPVETALVK